MRGFEPHRMHFRRLMTWLPFWLTILSRPFLWLLNAISPLMLKCLLDDIFLFQLIPLIHHLTTQTQVDHDVCYLDPYASLMMCRPLWRPWFLFFMIMIMIMMPTTWHNKTDQYSTRHDKTWQKNNTMQYNAIQYKRFENNTIQYITFDFSILFKTRQDNKTKQNTCKLPRCRDLTASIRARAV